MCKTESRVESRRIAERLRSNSGVEMIEVSVPDYESVDPSAIL